MVRSGHRAVMGLRLWPRLDCGVCRRARLGDREVWRREIFDRDNLRTQLTEPHTVPYKFRTDHRAPLQIRRASHLSSLCNAAIVTT